MHTLGALALAVTMHGGAHGHGTVFSWQGEHAAPVYSFCAESNCADGAEPSGLVRLADGSFIGATVHGAYNDCGVLFQLKATPAGWQQTVLWRFGQLFNDDDGCHPGWVELQGDAVVGTTHDGGFNGHGVLWRWRACRRRCISTFQVLHSFGKEW